MSIGTGEKGTMQETVTADALARLASEINRIKDKIQVLQPSTLERFLQDIQPYKYITVPFQKGVAILVTPKNDSSVQHADLVTAFSQTQHQKQPMMPVDLGEILPFGDALFLTREGSGSSMEKFRPYLQVTDDDLDEKFCNNKEATSHALMSLAEERKVEIEVTFQG